METEKGILTRLVRDIKKYGEYIETLSRSDAPQYLIAVYSQIRRNKINRLNELLKS